MSKKRMEWTDSRLRLLIFFVVGVSVLLIYLWIFFMSRLCEKNQSTEFAGDQIAWCDAFRDDRYYMYATDNDSVLYSITDREIKNSGFSPFCRFYYSVTDRECGANGYFEVKKDGKLVSITSTFANLTAASDYCVESFDSVYINGVVVPDCFVYESDNLSVSDVANGSDIIIDKYIISRQHGLIYFRNSDGKIYLRRFDNAG